MCVITRKGTSVEALVHVGGNGPGGIVNGHRIICTECLFKIGLVTRNITHPVHRFLEFAHAHLYGVGDRPFCLVFEGRWEEGLPQAISLQEEYPACARLVLPLSAMSLLAPALSAHLATRIDVSEAIVDGGPIEEIDTASIREPQLPQWIQDRLP